ncbi:MAG TPA: C45 family autoproteolytic acyltransferase/hydrolase [Opitutaceae bacterium]|mgnify:CR=1 FL=1|nr:C45 family autoproteolytic acyltransferase/hydrolase [Opitutaceae bacterium]
MTTPPVSVLPLSGTAADLGRQQGVALRNQIHANVAVLLGDFLTGAKAAQLEKIRAWQRRLRAFCFDHWPWLQAEIQGIAEGAGLDRELAELLSFRAWQYEVYHAGACSSFALPGAGGKILTGGTLDDPRFLYACAQVTPADGLRFISFPIAGTVWANRGLNEAGLALGISSLICPGVTFDLDQLVPVDLVFRDMLQFCSTVAEVEARCRRFKFFCNLVAVDRQGCVFSSSNFCGDYTAHPTADGSACLTNHPAGSADTALRARGYTGPDPAGFSPERLAQITGWMDAHRHRATVADAVAFLGAMPQPGRVNNPHTAFATIAVPQTHPSTLWIAQQPVTSAAFHAFDVRTGSSILN